MIRTILDTLSDRQKSLFVFSHDCVATAVSFCVAYYLKKEIFPWENNSEFLIQLGIISIVEVTAFYLNGLYRGIWRFSSTPDLIRIIVGVSFAVPLAYISLLTLGKHHDTNIIIFINQWTLLVVILGGSRFSYRLYSDKYNYKNRPVKLRNALIIGAGFAGQQLYRDIRNDKHSDFNVIGFIDDDQGKKNKILHGLKVFGSVKEISRFVRRFDISHVIIAIPSASKDDLSRIVKACNNTNVKVRSIPKLGDLISGKIQISKVRKVTPSDLLGRSQVDLHMQTMAHMLGGRVILVTGAGGSIGSELCNQIVKFKPATLVCIDNNELNLYELEHKFDESGQTMKIEYLIGDVRDYNQMESIFKVYKPQIAFHAAAYKHVPMMEKNPLQAIQVNVGGTYNIANLADKFNLEKFVLVSTDKAVNPTNVMGTTKRIAEMLCQCVQKDSETKFAIVRFGNVLGSSGSVIPRFQKQIEAGGPVTVTHPDIIRYFMSIPEAAQLVIQAGSIGKGGEIFVLDMGEPVKIYDLAKQMITLAGLKVDEDIKIEFTGLREGEKLYEELLADEETSLPTQHERVRVAKVRDVSDQTFESIMQLLEVKAENEVRLRLKKIVPEYEVSDEDLVTTSRFKDESFSVN